MRPTVPAALLAAVLAVPLGTVGCAQDSNRPAPAPSAEVGPSPTKEQALAPANPQMRAVLDQLAALGGKPIETLSPQEARKQPSPKDAVLAVLKSQGKSTAPRPVGGVEDRTLATGVGRTVGVRVYTPRGEGPFPAVVYYHGGGFVIASIDAYDASCRAVCDKADAVVVAVDYRQAPEHKFPAAPEDSYAALQYVFDHPGEFDAVPGEVAVLGESAGGNLATVVCLMAAERGGKMPVHQVLVYPMTNDAFDTASYVEEANAAPLNRAMMKWFWGYYLPDPAVDGANPFASPLRADRSALAKLPPATIITDQIDPLRSEGRAYADRLREAGVAVEAKNYEGVTHEFFGMAAVVDTAEEAQAFAVDGLKSGFGS